MALSFTGAAEVLYHVAPSKGVRKKEVSQLPRVPICFQFWAHCVSLQLDACDFPSDNYEEHSLPGHICTSAASVWVGTGPHQGHIYEYIYALLISISLDVTRII